MARVTVEDCVVRIPNRFKLVLLASQRARDLSAGATETVERENDKNPVVALREIADATVSIDELDESLVSGLQKYVEIDEPEDDSMAILAAAEKEWAGVTTDSPEDADGVTVVDATGKTEVEAGTEAAGEDDKPAEAEPAAAEDSAGKSAEDAGD